MYLKVLVFLVCVVVIFSGCAGSAKISPATLPKSYGPLEHDAELIAKIDGLFKDKATLGRLGDFTMPQLRIIARGTRSAPVAVLSTTLSSTDVMFDSHFP